MSTADTSAQPSVSVVLPCYNEADNIVPLVHALKAQLPAAHEILVMDDNSPDGTARQVRGAFAGDTSVRVHVRMTDRGLANSIADGIRRCRGELVIIMDSDFNHDPDIVGNLLAHSPSADVVLGSRFLPGGGMASRWRYYCSWIYSTCLVRPILRTRVRDGLCGYYLIHRDKLLALPLDDICYGYGDYFFRLLWHLRHRCYRVIEVPVFYRPRLGGKSKSNLPRLLMSYTWELIKIPLTARASEPADDAQHA